MGDVLGAEVAQDEPFGLQAGRAHDPYFSAPARGLTTAANSGGYCDPMPTFRHVSRLTLLALGLGTTSLGTVAVAKTSHEGWPTINGVLRMHKADESSAIHGTRHNDELLGGHGNDTVWGRGGDDVIWGDYKPSGQPTSQVDGLNGGAGNEYIYASHGLNVINAGAGNDTIHAHFGHGTIDCGPGRDLVFLSHRGRSGWKLRGCERISYKTLGY